MMKPTSPDVAMRVRALKANEAAVITALATATAALEQLVLSAPDEPEQSIEVRLERFKAIKQGIRTLAETVVRTVSISTQVQIAREMDSTANQQPTMRTH
jgi:hypothetical protein